MGLEIVRCVRKGVEALGDRKRVTPRYVVRCPDCEREYERTGYPGEIARTPLCGECGNMARGDRVMTRNDERRRANAER